MIDVIFKKYKKENEIIAFFPYEVTHWAGYFTCYAHIGQHSQCNIDYYKQCVRCSYDEYKPLLDELKMIGYDNLNIVNRINYNKMRDAYNDFMTRLTLERN